MSRDTILEELETLWEFTQSSNIGSGEAELEFRELVADWILALVNSKRDERHR